MNDILRRFRYLPVVLAGCVLAGCAATRPEMFARLDRFQLPVSAPPDAEWDRATLVSVAPEPSDRFALREELKVVPAEPATEPALRWAEDDFAVETFAVLRIGSGDGRRFCRSAQCLLYLATVLTDRSADAEEYFLDISEAARFTVTVDPATGALRFSDFRSLPRPNTAYPELFLPRRSLTFRLGWPPMEWNGGELYSGDDFVFGRLELVVPGTGADGEASLDVTANLQVFPKQEIRKALCRGAEPLSSHTPGAREMSGFLRVPLRAETPSEPPGAVTDAPGFPAGARKLLTAVAPRPEGFTAEQIWNGDIPQNWGRVLYRYESGRFAGAEASEPGVVFSAAAVPAYRFGRNVPVYRLASLVLRRTDGAWRELREPATPEPPPGVQPAPEGFSIDWEWTATTAETLLLSVGVTGYGERGREFSRHFLGVLDFGEETVRPTSISPDDESR